MPITSQILFKSKFLPNNYFILNINFLSLLQDQFLSILMPFISPITTEITNIAIH